MGVLGEGLEDAFNLSIYPASTCLGRALPVEDLCKDCRKEGLDDVEEINRLYTGTGDHQLGKIIMEAPDPICGVCTWDKVA